MPAGQHTRQKIFGQPAIWSEALHAFQQGRSALLQHIAGEPPESVVVTGCGSTYYLALTAARLVPAGSPASGLLSGTVHGSRFRSTTTPERRHIAR